MYRDILGWVPYVQGEFPSLQAHLVLSQAHLVLSQAQLVPSLVHSSLNPGAFLPESWCFLPQEQGTFASETGYFCLRNRVTFPQEQGTFALRIGYFHLRNRVLFPSETGTFPQKQVLSPSETGTLFRTFLLISQDSTFMMSLAGHFLKSALSQLFPGSTLTHSEGSLSVPT